MCDNYFIQYQWCEKSILALFLHTTVVYIFVHFDSLGRGGGGGGVTRYGRRPKLAVVFHTLYLFTLIKWGGGGIIGLFLKTIILLCLD